MKKTLPQTTQEKKERPICAPQPVIVKGLLKDYVGHIAKQTGAEEQEVIVQLWLNWNAIMSDIKPPCCPLGHKEDCIFIAVSDNMEMMEIRYKAQDIIQRANHFLRQSSPLFKGDFFTTIHPTLLLDKEDLSRHKEFTVEQLGLENFEKLTGENLKGMESNSAIAVCYRAFIRKMEAYEKGEDLSLLAQDAEPFPVEKKKPVLKQEERKLIPSVAETPEEIRRAIKEELSYAILMEESREEGENPPPRQRQSSVEQQKEEQPKKSRLSGKFLSEMDRFSLITQCYKAFSTLSVAEKLPSTLEEIPSPPTSGPSAKELYLQQEAKREKLEGTHLADMKAESGFAKCYKAFLARSRGEKE